jgi:TRAP-type C4-dicarboxylate transport system permease large subunit
MMRTFVAMVVGKAMMEPILPPSIEAVIFAILISFSLSES